MENFTPTDAIALENSRGGYGYGDGVMSWFWIIIILFFAWGNNGWGNNNGNNCAEQFIERDIFTTNQNVSTTGCQTQRDVLESKYDLGTQILENRFQNQLCCCNTDKEILENRYQNALQTNTLQNQASTNALNAQMQLSECCCDLKAEGLANTQKILDKLCENEINQLRTDLQSAQLQISQLSQTANITNALRPFPIPAYITYSPYQSAFNNGFGYGYGFNNGCGCNGNATII